MHNKKHVEPNWWTKIKIVKGKVKIRSVKDEYRITES